jgi:hypothetical protein
MSVILFAGGGASAPLGYPTTTTFFGSPPINPGWDNEMWRLFSDLFVGEEGVLGGDGVVDVERVLQFLDNSTTFFDGHAGAFVKKYAGAPWLPPLNHLRQLITGRYFSLYGKPAPLDDVTRIYMPLLDVLGFSNHPVSLFTTNFDPVPDSLMGLASASGLASYDGFDGSLYWDPDGYDHLDQGLAIYRLHGALSWIREGHRIKNTRIYDEVPRSLIDYLFLYPGFESKFEDEASKVFAFLQAALSLSLAQARLVLIIGYSFKNPSLNDVFKASMQKNKQLHLFLVMPRIPATPGDGIESLLSTFQSRVKHFSTHFGDPRDSEEEDSLSSLYETAGRFVP